MKMSNFLSLVNRLFSKTFWIFVSPVIIGTLMAFGDGIHNWPIALWFLAGFLAAYFVFDYILKLGKSVVSLKNSAILETMMFVLLGPFAVCGSYYAQSHEMNTAVILASLPPGLFTISCLTALSFKRGEGSGKNYFVIGKYFFTLYTAAILPVFIYAYTNDNLFTIFTTCICLYSIPVILKIRGIEENSSHDLIFKSTIKMYLIYTAIFSLGWIL
ncbi:MAG: hypothetical protein HQL27_08160 [Candidatus Omnitrophica bacterium]|nr:hypothetical protein [Candidatus Omnitrophota bacterium]